MTERKGSSKGKEGRRGMKEEGKKWEMTGVGDMDERQGEN